MTLPTPRDSSFDDRPEDSNPKKGRTRNRHISYALHFEAPSDDDTEETTNDREEQKAHSDCEDYNPAESDYGESFDASTSEEFDPDPEITASPEPESPLSRGFSEDPETDAVDLEEPEVSAKAGKPKRQRTKGNSKSKRSPRDRGINEELPPLSNIQDIFDDITNKALKHGLKDALQALNGNEFRVATMCSGTESPVLALQLVSEALQKCGAAPLRLRHVFSAEIVPKKQAYIERNFHPPIIFRDIRELTREEAFISGATNVYGAKVPIPGDVDLLVAGFSCVDFSLLNNKGKTLDQKGESRDTLEAILSYAEKWKPKMIVLENVYGAPWEDCVQRAKKVGYAAEFVRVDTKDYYLPHTRTRGYMVCINKDHFPGDAHAAVGRWKNLMLDSKRRASAPASAFLLPTDDHRVHQFNIQLASQYRRDGRERTVNWDACRHRHQKVRRQDGLGFQHPITNWIDNGTCTTVEHAHKLWFAKQVERVWDSIEIRFLRAAKDDTTDSGYDPHFKTSIMELSQNVDRFAQEMPFGICSCITPSGIFYVTDRGGPLTPYETLALQGLPLDKISFTIETMKELQDLAGNAMSSTVVGVAQLAALIVASPMLKRRGNSCSSSESSNTISRTETALCGEELLQRYLLHHKNKTEDHSMRHLCEDASQSIRLCRCEGQYGATDKEIFVCGRCRHTVCAECKSKPPHSYVDSLFNRTLTAHEFEIRWKPLFPPSLELTNLPDIPGLTKCCQGEDGLKDRYFDAVAKALRVPFKFQHFKRTAKWAIVYESPLAILKLEITKQAEWRVYVKAPAELSGNDQLRKALETPVARAKLPASFEPSQNQHNWAEQWEWFVPSYSSFPVSIQEEGPETNRSWRALYGLVDYQEETVPRQLRVTVHSGKALPENVSGVYEHLPDCGTACSSLYRRTASLEQQPVTSQSHDESNPLFLFLEPTRIGPVNDDGFVFSHTHERVEYGEVRDTVAKLCGSFRPWDPSSFSTHCSLAGLWVLEKNPSTILRAEKKLLIINGPSPLSTWGAHAVRKCSESLTVLSMKFHADEESSGSREYRFDERSSSVFMKRFSWILSTNAHLPELKQWRQLDIDTKECTTCAPALPSIKWAQTGARGKNAKSSLIAQEDPVEAAEYERTMKRRPRILTMTATVDESQNCHLRVALNVVSLAHRALSKLPISQKPPTVSWSVTTEYVPQLTPSLPRFRLLSNFGDQEQNQPRGFALKLRPAQRRSLSWMLKQESGTKFTLQEVAEEVAEPIRWRIEVKAEADIVVKGGVVADQVSYGKTITSLALIHAGFCEDQSAPNDTTGLIPLRATLILVPNNLPNQWRQEALKSLPKADYGPKEILLIKTAKDLDGLRIQDLMQAKIVIAPFTLCGKDYYTNRLAQLTALPETPSTDGRQYEAWFNYALKRIPAMNERLKELGVSAFEEHLKKELQRTWQHADFTGIIPSKRTKGSNYKGLEEQPEYGKTKPKPAASKPAIKPKEMNTMNTDWKRMSCPVLHQFKWNRVIIDEFHYPRGRDYLALVTLPAEKRWILSGTPPLDDFADIKRFAAFLGVSLGIDWDAPGVITHENSKQMRKEKTSFELFQTFSERRSAAWHERRHTHAQAFLDAFARQNFAEIGEVKCHETLKSVILPLDHRAIYEELSSHLKGRNMTMTKLSYETGDRAMRIRHCMRDSNTAEEALVHCCSINITEGSLDGACVALQRRRERELRSQERELSDYVLQAARLARACGDPQGEWRDWVVRYTGDDSNGVEDQKAHQDLKSMIERAKQDRTRITNKRLVDAADELQSLVRNKLGSQARKFVALRRSLRYIRSAIKLKMALHGETDCAVQCECGDSLHRVPAPNATLIIGCGHIFCRACLDAALLEERCRVPGCGMEVREHSVLHADKLQQASDIAQEEVSFGAKLDTVIGILEGTPEEEQAIIFVQSYRMMSIVGQSLAAHGISAYAIDRVSDSASDKIDNFIHNAKYTDSKKTKLNRKFGKALILNLGDESAAGMNLVNANHIIFISPLLTATNQKYQAAMVQSIGRARRYGQKREVYVYRLVAPHTIDVDILEHRELRSQALCEQMQMMEPPYEPGKEGYERTRLIRNTDGQIMLVPKSWTQDANTASQHGIGLNVGDSVVERFSSLTVFSDAYAQDGDA
ncbi:hypothetical protein B0J12DRAFT_693058 [Macrophomina phaseolina]|uniref:Helicase C-terminal domain-containing protein n=1 Tax=Macrophomina phaseolina TaxID=35725 RepID=A0ABQ8GTP9_9PEZI|nr:hypothetical protein B0J12DRAFT_693058 [Macrophomina phaseolina]